ncbi:MAG: hypothetical protein REV35_01715 [Burkholderia sp.]|nr:hypothetical protein [Burkholderia sp.]
MKKSNQKKFSCETVKTKLIKSVQIQTDIQTQTISLKTALNKNETEIWSFPTGKRP